MPIVYLVLVISLLVLSGLVDFREGSRVLS